MLCYAPHFGVTSCWAILMQELVITVLILYCWRLQGKGLSLYVCFVWQHMVPSYGAPPHPYMAMYPHGGLYAHPSIPPVLVVYFILTAPFFAMCL